MTLTVTVKDNETGDTETAQVPDDDYFIVYTGAVRVDVRTFRNGTHVLTVRGRRPGQPKAAA